MILENFEIRDKLFKLLVTIFRSPVQKDTRLSTMYNDYSNFHTITFKAADEDSTRSVVIKSNLFDNVNINYSKYTKNPLTFELTNQKNAVIKELLLIFS